MSLKSLVASGTTLWLDSVDPDLVVQAKKAGATGATSNPIIVSDLIKTGRFDERLTELAGEGKDDESIAWALTDRLVKDTQEQFIDAWKQSKGNTGWVSFELEPLLEDVEADLPHETRVKRYVELGKKWSAGHENRMIKVPATPAGIDALEALATAGISLNVTLIFSERQYIAARDAVWRGAQQRAGGLSGFKSVYSIFVSRVDVYTEKHVPELSEAAQGQVGIVNVKRLWQMNQQFWKDKNLPLKQEIVFASTGTKKKQDPPDKYVEALAGSDIQTNPPATNDAVDRLNKQYTKQVDQLPPPDVQAEIDQKVDVEKMEQTLMSEGLSKFADPQKALLKLIAEKRAKLTK